MMHRLESLTRRRCFQVAAASSVAWWCRAPHASALQPTDKSTANKALVCITLDLEMSRNFPTWETTHWDYEKGNLDQAAKQYALEAARRVAAAGGHIHFFVVGRVLEQASVDWLRELAAAGHPLGNHTYDHVNVTAARLEDIQFRFQRAPWLVAGQTPTEVIRQNVRLCDAAMQERLLVKPNGFRTPGGFASGLKDHPEVREFLRQQGYSWVSSLYPPHPNTTAGQRPSKAVLDGIVRELDQAQPFVYPDGLIEVPMSPISDIGAFRNGRWQLPWYLEAIERCVQRTIEHQMVFDFLAHPSCLGIVDPHFETIDLICNMVRRAGERAQLATLDMAAARARHASATPP